MARINVKNLPPKTKALMSLGIILGLTIALPLFIWSIINLNFNTKEKAANSEPVDITAGEPMLGPTSAPITIVMYSDFTCSDCKTFVDSILPTILSNYPTEVRLVYKDFPVVTEDQPLSEKAAIAGQCAYRQDKFWDMHDFLFTKDTLVESEILEFAASLDIDTEQFNNCYNNSQTLSEVQDDISEGTFKGVTKTPTFFIEGTKLDGLQLFSVFKAIIDTHLTSLATASPTTVATASPYVEGEPNSCGGTCGSNYNCKANLYCYKGFCRNPICSESKDCNCPAKTASPTLKPTLRSTIKPISGLNKTASPKATLKATSTPTATPEVLLTSTDELNDLENMFWTKNAIYIFAVFLLIAISTIFYAIRKNKQQEIPHIMPPTNI